jgi:hypothetical protein
MSGIMGLGKPSILVTTLSSNTSLLRGGLLEGEWGSPGWWLARTIARSQDFIPGARAGFWISRDFMDGCRTWDPRGHGYDMLVRFFPYRVYIDSNHRDTLGYEWPLARCCHLVVCLDVFWMDGLEYGYGYGYHDDYCITLIIMLITLLMLALCML